MAENLRQFRTFMLLSKIHENLQEGLRKFMGEFDKFSGSV